MDLVNDRIKRIEEKKKIIGSKHLRKIKKYSNNFNLIFSFFLECNRKGLLTFSGSTIHIVNDPNEIDSKECFRLYDDGFYKNGKEIRTRHSNIVKAVINSKKSWGLWLQEWTDGICDFTFTKEELLKEFENNNISIPESFMNDFDNTLEKKKIRRNSIYLEELRRKV